MSWRSRVGFGILVGGLGVATAASAADDGSGGTRWTVEDAVTAERIEEIGDVSRDGRIAVWVRSEVREGEKGPERVSDLWLARLDDGQAMQWTRSEGEVSGPVISPDGSKVAFLSDRELPEKEESGDETADTQVWVVPTSGGEAWPVTRFDTAPTSVAWRDGETLVVLAPEARSAWHRERKDLHDTSVVVEDEKREPPTRLFEVGAEGGDVRRITVNEDWIDAVAVSPDGERAIVTAQRSLSWEFDQRTPAYSWLVDLETGERTRLFADLGVLPHSIQWAPDGSRFYFADERTTHPRFRTATVTDLWEADADGGSARRIDLAWDRGLGGGYAPIEGGFVALLADGVTYRPARYRRGSNGTWRREELAGAHVPHLQAIAASSNGERILYEHSRTTVPPQLYAAGLEGTRVVDERRLTDLNPSFATKPKGKIEVIRYPGALGEEVEAILHYPLDWGEGEKRRPLVLDIHGGPTGTDRDVWEFDWHDPGIFFRQRGAFLLQVNYHGSTGYGLEWVESIGEGNYYDFEPTDIENGVDLLIERGLADPEKLGVTGWSNGGILAAELITRTRRYKAASVGAADVEWISDWANVDFGKAFDEYYFGASPFENPELYIEKSPFFRLPEVTTPTIAFTGTEDRAVPPHQSWSLYRALQQETETPVRLVLFPGEPHGIQEIAHQRRKLEEELAWFDRYLFRTLEPQRDWLEEGSPLAALLARAGASRTEGALGSSADGILVPETVSFAGLEVGRFEVTRAQYRQFDPDHAPAPGEEDLPVTGVGIEQARAYVSWLSERTGRNFRLPTVEEAERLADAAGEDGNTLSRWAGYSPNPENEASIRQALAGLGTDAPLLLPVGMFPGAGRPAVFDLDGNAAEWATDDTGGRPVGPSADRADDPRDEGKEPSPAYVGFRVVVE